MNKHDLFNENYLVAVNILISFYNTISFSIFSWKWGNSKAGHESNLKTVID